VPIVAASRADVPMDSPLLRRVPDQHGNLQRNAAALDELEGVLTARSLTVRGLPTVDLRVEVPDLVLAGDPLVVRVAIDSSGHHSARVIVTDETNRMVDSRVAKPAPGEYATAVIDDLPPGAYSVDVTGLAPGSPLSPVSTDVLVWA
jgi:hypothetical protein